MMRPQNRTVIKQNAFLFWLITLFAASLACGLGTGKSAIPPTASVIPPTSTAVPLTTLAKPPTASAIPPTAIATSIATIKEVTSTQTDSTEALSKSFSLPADTEIDLESVAEDDPGRGSFRLRSTAALSGLVDFYKTTLPTQGWTYRYTDANYIGGVTQFWKKDNLYLSLQFGYDKNEALVRINYNRIAADTLEKLPKDFSIPDKAELTNATDTSWNFYIDQDYAAVIAFYTEASTGWAKGSGFGGMFGEGDGGPEFPPGVTPMPAPTRDSRLVKSYSWILPDQNQVDLTITPHGAATLLYISLTSLNVSDSGLPADIPIYPGAKIQNVTPGMVTFQAGASLETVKTFYEEKLKAAGWMSVGQPFESEGAVLMNWEKGDQSVMITLSAIGADDCLVIIMGEGS